MTVASPQLPTAHGDATLLKKVASRPSRCSDLCLQNGGTCNEELGRCDCQKSRKGQYCQEEVPEEELSALCTRLGFPGPKMCLADAPCLNKCNDRGVCVQGFCQCLPGHFGTDCSLSLDDNGMPQILQGTSYTTRAKRPWVYIYELPPVFNAWVKRIRIDRPTFFYFWQRFLSSGTRTADPDKADLFFIPVYMRHPADNAKLARAVEYLGTHWPYLNRTGGMAKHVVIHGGDWGKKEHEPFKGKVLGLQEGIVDGMTWLTHWGVYKPVHSPSHPPGTSPRESLLWAPAHNPGRDVVVPVPEGGGFGHDKSPLHPLSRNPPVRNTTFFHAGRVCGVGLPNTSQPWPFNCPPRGRRYSGAVRQRVHAYHHNRTGYAVLPHVKNFSQMLMRSKFCLATQGGGHGNRQVIAAVSGCIPVVIGDHVYQPFEPELDWNDFSVRVLEEQIPILHEILAAVDEETYRRKQAALRCGAQHVLFSSMRGSLIGESGHYDAFETTLEILRAHIDHPGVPPQDLQKVDEKFKRFMACGADEVGQEPPPREPGTPAVCSKSAFDGPSSCRHCVYKSLLGGAHTMCCNSLDLAACPRLWS